MSDEFLLRARENELPEIFNLGSPLHEDRKWFCCQWIREPSILEVVQAVLKLSVEDMDELNNQIVGEEEGPWYMWLPDGFGEKLAAMTNEDIEQLAKQITRQRNKESLGYTRDILHEALDEVVRKVRPSSKLLYWIEL